MLNELSYKELKDSTTNDIEFRAAAYDYAANIYEAELKRISAHTVIAPKEDDKNWLTTRVAKTEVNPETSYQKD